MASEQRADNANAAMLSDLLGIMPSLYASADLDDTFARITQAAVDVLDACDYASITITSGRQMDTRASTSEVALAADRLQYEERQGPCLDAVTRDQWVITPDVQKDQRWPRYSARLHGELDVHSMLSVRLAVAAAPPGTWAGSTCTPAARTPSPMTSETWGCCWPRSPPSPPTPPGHRPRWRRRCRPGRSSARRSASSETKATCPAREAFAVLAQASQRMNIRLRDVATGIAEGHAWDREAEETGPAGG